MRASQTEGQAPGTVKLVDGRQLTLAAGLSTDRKIAAIAERQRARVSRQQLLLAGVDDAAVDRRLASGKVVPIHPGVYALAHTLELALGAEVAALLACGEGAALSHHSAMTLWGLRPGVARPIHVTIPRDSAGPKLADVAVHRSRTLRAADVRICQGLPVTSPARALLDAAAVLPDRDLERLLDEALFAQRLVTRAEIDAALRRAGGHPGRWRLARVAGAHTSSTKTESPPEEALLRLIRAARLPEPQLQVNVLGYRLDLYWPALRLAVEVDAYRTHGSPTRFEQDRRRDARLLSEKGIVVLRFTRLAIQTRALETIAVLARAIGQREAQLRAA